MRSEYEMKRSLQESFERIPVPESLYRFADEVPGRFAAGDFTSAAEPAPASRRSARFKLFKSVAAAAILVSAFSAGVTMSPAFASLVKEVPGFEIAVDWLTHVRQQDGVQTAVDHGYTPIEPATVRFDGTSITIDDIYLTDDELLFKAFIRSTDYDVTDGRSPVHLSIVPSNLRGGGSTTASYIAETTDGSSQPVRQDTYKYQLEENAVHNFMASGQTELVLQVSKVTSDHELKRSTYEDKGSVVLTVDRQKLLHNIVMEPHQSLPLAVSDPDWKELTLEKLTIQPTTMNAMIFGKRGWHLEFPRDEAAAPYMKDDKGNTYRYDPSGPGLLAGDGKLQLPFSSSVFFDSAVRTMYLHIGEVRVTENEPSGSFELSLRDTFPRTIRFHDRDIVIEGAEYHREGYLQLKLNQEQSGGTGVAGISFRMPEYEKRNAGDREFVDKMSKLREDLHIDGFGAAANGSIYIPAPEQERYTISMQRAYDRVVVNQDYPIRLER